MKKKNNVMMIAVIAITLLMIGCVIVMGIIRNSNRNNPDVKPPEQTTDTTAHITVTPLKLLHTRIEVSAGKIIRLEISSAPIILMPTTTVRAVRTAMSVL